MIYGPYNMVKRLLLEKNSAKSGKNSQIFRISAIIGSIFALIWEKGESILLNSAKKSTQVLNFNQFAGLARLTRGRRAEFQNFLRSANL